MSVNLEQIEILKERAHVSYAEAKEILEKCNYDVVEALIYLEGQSKVKPPKTEHNCCSHSKKFFKTTGGLIKKGNEIKFVIKKDGNSVIDLPLNIVIVATVVATPVVVVGVLIALFTHHKIGFIKPTGEDMEINKTLDKISTAVSSVSDQVVEAVNKKQ